MKRTLFLFLTLFLLTACKPAEKPVDTGQSTAGSSMEGMTEEEKQAYMIKLIEQEEARMRAAGEL